MEGQAPERPRDRKGRFSGLRFNVEKVPRLPTFPARWALEDPGGRPHFVFWTTEDGELSYSLRMIRIDGGTAVRVTMPSGMTRPIKILRRPLPSGTGTMILYCCPICEKPRRYLYRLMRTGLGLADYFGLQCQACAGLRWASQGRYRNHIERAVSSTISLVYGRPTGGLIPRYPWDPRAVSNPRMAVAEFPDLLWEAETAPGAYCSLEQFGIVRPGKPPERESQHQTDDRQLRAAEEIRRLFRGLLASDDLPTRLQVRRFQLRLLE